MVDRSATLRRVAAELRAELLHIDRTVTEAESLSKSVATERVMLYATAALLDTFYTAIEKAMRRVAGELGGIPAGPGWHRRLLDDMILEIPKIRPAVFSAETARALSAFLAFRHRFRNLYLFDLEPAPLASLLLALAPTWAAARTELDECARFIELLADELT